MIYHDYSPEQLERAAEQLLLQFDPDLLKQPKKYDVYAVIENCLGVEYDWKYIRPDQKILGLTAFKDLTASFAWNYPIADDFRAEEAVCEMAKLFGVSKQAMRYRLYNLKLLQESSSLYR